MITRSFRRTRPGFGRLPSRLGLRVACLAGGLALLAGCDEKPAAPTRPPIEVTAMTLAARDTPVTLEFVAQTESSREVEIRARVAGFLDKRLYKEGDLVKVGQVLFQMDRKPFEAALQSAQGQLAQQQALLEMARADLVRVRPLVKIGALSKKSLDDAIGNERQAQAAVLSAEGLVRTAQINLGYTTIASPLTGVSSFAKQQDGSYVTPGEAGLLTYVSQVDPMYVNFSLSENEMLKYRNEIAANQLRFPPNNAFEVEVVLADGSVVPDRGRLSFADFAFSETTGTFLIRAELANSKGLLRPGQFVRAHVKGAIRPKAVLVPQRAVLQGPRSHYVWVIDNDGKPEQRVVEMGDWHGDDWFVSQGLRLGERIVVDGAIRVSPGAQLKIVEASPAAESAGDASGSQSPVAAEALQERMKVGPSDKGSAP
ncbi:membrane fusion protein, multidrug efflux system [Azotobacter beijerinckii]|uniref:Membrane fusion protein, multidrug efflux system n=2 Tax=Azotobacter beijerinckii TaxID=170623 RepID=A0A1H6QWI8_9GAMM|nr:efflux RND transporter periplasmic adaptor subunit [Azotobacter beijerinckii]SEI46436.1 membrane fusion protein, multidrug efflux system [Azotobacter beijerinckii]SEJ17264.1 membrane fusion protein, multidrug efflux system [Azotobacter beijerinckii]